ncbi:hypothetical protein BH10CYA1_BH10CYA1_56300 [soil metagenome]
METEKDILEYVNSGKLELSPLRFTPMPESIERSDIDPDVMVQTNWQGRTFAFVGEVNRYGSDKSVSQAAEQARYYAERLQVSPLVIVPWLSNELLFSLERKNISGVDLCGNGVVVVPGELLVFRTGQPNKFPTSRLIRRVYEGTSSLVARVFLLRPQYNSLSEILDEITARGGSITLPTISKALKQLEEDLVIEKSSKRIRILQADKLLDRLKSNYAPPKPRGSVRCKLTTKNNDNIGAVLLEAAKQAGERIVLSGESSANFYATMAKEPIDTFYCTETTTLQLEKWNSEMDIFSRFPNVELKKCDSEVVYFDMQNKEGYNIASPIQAYLELATSDKRGQEIAEQIRKKIIQDVQDRQEK